MQINNVRTQCTAQKARSLSCLMINVKYDLHRMKGILLLTYDRMTGNGCWQGLGLGITLLCLLFLTPLFGLLFGSRSRSRWCCSHPYLSCSCLSWVHGRMAKTYIILFSISMVVTMYSDYALKDLLLKQYVKDHTKFIYFFLQISTDVGNIDMYPVAKLAFYTYNQCVAQNLPCSQ